MRLYHPPSGLRRGLDLCIDPNWSAEQALAVIELLDDLRDRIGSHYAFALAQQCQNDRINRYDVMIDDPPF